MPHEAQNDREALAPEQTHPLLPREALVQSIHKHKGPLPTTEAGLWDKYLNYSPGNGPCVFALIRTRLFFLYSAMMLFAKIPKASCRF